MCNHSEFNFFVVEEGYRTDKEGTAEEDGLAAGQCSVC